MSIIQAIILGIVQGITEFLPVSSSGHLAIIQNIFHIQTDGGLFFDVMLHLGTLVAIFVVYRKDILRMIVETVNMCGDIIYNPEKLYSESAFLQCTALPQDRKKQLSQVCGTGAGIYHTDRYHWLYRKGNG